MAIKTSLAQKIFLFFLSLVLSLVLIELTLRTAEMILLAGQSFNNRSSFAKTSTIRIMCIGESTTFGGDESYPSQLEKILNSSSPNKRFKVINKGIPGQRSDYILDHVEQW